MEEKTYTRRLDNSGNIEEGKIKHFFPVMRSLTKSVLSIVVPHDG